MTHHILITEITTDAEYSLSDIHLWREDFKHYFKRKHPYYHNHDLVTGKTDNTYPLIQYRSYQNKAALFGLQDGAKMLDNDLSAGVYNFVSRTGKEGMSLTKIQYPFELALTDSIFTYKIQYYCPFNPENHKKWFGLSLDEKNIDLIKRLRFQILNHLCKKIGWRVSGQLQLRIIEMKENNRLVRKDLDYYFDNFDFIFQSNMLLPEGIALGKNVAYGYGVLSNY